MREQILWGSYATAVIVVAASWVQFFVLLKLGKGYYRAAKFAHKRQMLWKMRAKMAADQAHAAVMQMHKMGQEIQKHMRDESDDN